MNKFLAETNFGSCDNVYVLMPSMLPKVSNLNKVFFWSRRLWFWAEVFCKYLLFVDKLVEEINNIIQNKRECQTMEYDIQFICCSCKITEIERKHIMRKHRKKNICMTAWNLLPKKGFWKTLKENIQLWMLKRRKNYFPNAMRN